MSLLSKHLVVPSYLHNRVFIFLQSYMIHLSQRCEHFSSFLSSIMCVDHHDVCTVNFDESEHERNDFSFMASPTNIDSLLSKQSTASS